VQHAACGRRTAPRPSSLGAERGPAVLVLRPAAVENILEAVGLEEELRLLAAPAAAAVRDHRHRPFAACEGAHALGAVSAGGGRAARRARQLRRLRLRLRPGGGGGGAPPAVTQASGMSDRSIESVARSYATFTARGRPCARGEA
jgi:hypothetical protein